MQYLKKIIRLLFYIFFWSFTFLVIIFILYYKDAYTAWEELQKIDPDKYVHFGRETMTNFRHMDSWNLLYTSFIITLLLFLFFVSDRLLKSILKTIQGKENTKSGLQKQNLWLYSFTWSISKLLVTILVVLEFILISNLVIWVYAYPKVTHKPSSVDPVQHALLLGTNKRLRYSQGENLYYRYRIDAANELYKSGKVRQILISGDNTGRYNEPLDMKADLLRKGIPDGAIKIDYAGFRTLDSIVRLKYHFGIDKVVAVSQSFHLKRAIFLGWFYGVDVQGYVAAGSMTRQMWVRELFAKPKVILDIFVLNIQPRFGQADERIQLDVRNKNHQVMIGAAALLLISSMVFFLYSFLPVFKAEKSANAYKKAISTR